MGIDNTNSNKPYWYSECFDVALEWGAKYGASQDFYILKQKDTIAKYGYCNLDVTDPLDCNGNWYIYDGTQYIHETSFSVKYCSYYTVCYLAINLNSV